MKQKPSGERWFESVIKPELDANPSFAAALRDAAPRLAEFARFIAHPFPTSAVAESIVKAGLR